MPIQVTCSKCLKRFEVSEKFAGKTGPCPSCKNPIKIPTLDEQVVVHGGEEFGEADSKSGRPVLKPLEREEAAWSPIAAVVIGFAVLLVVVVAVALRGNYQDEPPPMWLLGLAATLLGPPLAAGAYTFLRDSELEPHRGVQFWLRAAACGVGYAVLWGVFAYVKLYFLEAETLEVFQLAFIVPAMVAMGGGVALVSLDLEYTSGLLHYGCYLVATIVLRLIVGLNFM